MDHRGHPKKPINRDELPLESLVESFVQETSVEDPALAKKIGALDEKGRNELGGILGRFDIKKRGSLDAGQRLLARRVLLKLKKLSGDTLILTNKILDYLDLNQDAILDESEMGLIVEIMELFARADSDNDTLSPLELEMLFAVLRHIDSNDNGKLDPNEKELLRKGLEDPVGFLSEQRATNPLLKRLL